MNEKKQSPLSLLFKWAGKEKYKLYFSIFCGIVSGLMVIAPYIAIYKIVEKVYFQQATSEVLLNYGIMLAISIIIRYFFMGLGIVVSHKGAYNALYNVRCMIVNHMAKVPLGYLSERDSGEIKRVISEDIEKLELFLAHHLSEIFMYSSGPLAIFIYLCTVNWVLALITLIPIPIGIMLQFMMFKGQSARMKEFNRVIGNLNSAMIEYISGMKLIKAYNMGAGSYKKYKGAIDDQSNLWKKIAYTMGPLYAVFVIVLQCAVVVIIPLGGFMFNNGSVNAGTVILFSFVGVLYLLELRPLMELGSNFSRVLNGITNAKEIIDIPAYREGDKFFPKNTDIEFKNVTFSYDGRENILKNVNFTIKAGEKIAFVGKSGAGKSTIIQLIARFFDINKGEILIGGKNIQTIDYETLLQNISIVFQNTFLTKQSIFENIKMGTEASIEEVKEAAKKAQIHSVIEKLPEGYYTKAGDYGSRFSGGEKQRIAIARAILKNAPILILDEATSAADPENQYEIDKAIDNLCINKTVIIVAHRLNAVKKCRRIAVVEDNSVKHMGTHEEMLKENKYYREVWDFYNKSKNIQYSVKAGV